MLDHFPSHTGYQKTKGLPREKGEMTRRVESDGPARCSRIDTVWVRLVQPLSNPTNQQSQSHVRYHNDYMPSTNEYPIQLAQCSVWIA